MRTRYATLWTWAVLLMGLCAVSPATDELTATTAPSAVATGTTVGVVKDRSADFLFVQPPGDVGRRHWLTAATRPDETPDPAVAAAVARVSVGDEVDLRWSGGDRRRIESVKVTRRAAMAAAIATTRPATATATSAPVTASEPAAASGPVPTSGPAIGLGSATGSTVGESVNAAIDNAVAVAGRVTELPIWLLLAGVFVVGGGWVLLARRLERWGRPVAATRARTIGRVVGVLFVALLIDRKISRLQSEVDALRTRLSGDTLAVIDKTATRGRAGRPLLIDPAAAQRALATHFKDVTLRPSAYDAATDVVQIRVGDPLVAAYLAVVDLSNPHVRITLGTDLSTKTLTSDFAKANGCSLAINGEAGQSPALNSGLGVWRGHMLYGGQTISREDPTIPRPFIGFGPGNRATFVPASQADRAVPAGLPTVIWGRLDSITGGVVQTADERYRQPRTAMGVGQGGTRLYLLVVDGRQRGYSTGMTRAEVGYVLQAFGADNAMLCDEGGSSCMYLRDSGGIVNVPSDNAGEERPTYTHFGVSVTGAP